MTGEMCKAEVTREAYPLHFKFADTHRGTVKPFDQYQGPYVLIPGRGRFWLNSDDGHFARWYDEREHTASFLFSPYGEDMTQCVDAFDQLMEGSGFPCSDTGEVIES